MGNDIDQRVVLLRSVLGDPVADAGHVVALENVDGVVAETGLQGGEASGERVIDAQFEYAGALGMHAVGDQRSGSDERARGRRRVEKWEKS